MNAHDPHPWLDDRLTAGERAGLLLAHLSLDEKMAQVSCYFPADITDVGDFSERYPHGVGVVSALEARSALTRDDVTAFQRQLQAEAMDRSGYGIPAIFHMEGLCGA